MEDAVAAPAELIGSAALEALLFEAAASPKPGLVCPGSRGSHRDMDYFAFLASGAALAPWFVDFARLGRDFRGDDPAALLPLLRDAGKAAERDMFAATGGANTHKGLIFSLGILCAAAGSLAGRRNESRPDVPSRSDPARLGAESCAAAAAAMLRGVSERDFGALASRDPSSLTAGERLFLRFGVRGIRGEAEAGFPAVLRLSLPRLKAGLASGLRMNDALVDALLALFAEVEDTNVLSRGGPEGLALLRSEASAALSLGGMASEAGREAVAAMDELLTARNLSPGGCADLLAVTAFLLKLDRIGGAAIAAAGSDRPL